MTTIPPIAEWSGKLPTLPRYFFSCADHKYFLAFVPEFIMSARDMNNPLHVNVFNPTPEAVETAEFCNTMSPNITVSWFHLPDDPSLRGITGKQRSAYACNVRYHMMPHLLAWRETERVYGVDVDSVFNRHFDMAGPSQQPLGLFLRDTWDLSKIAEADRSRMMCLLSMWWIDKPLLGYAKAVSDYINSRELKWMLDQEAYYAVMMDMGLRASCFDIALVPHLLDWKFVNAGTVWTGKGALKNSDPTLIKRRIALKERYLEAKYSALPQGISAEHAP